MARAEAECRVVNIKYLRSSNYSPVIGLTKEIQIKHAWYAVASALKVEHSTCTSRPSVHDPVVSALLVILIVGVSLMLILDRHLLLDKT